MPDVLHWLGITRIDRLVDERHEIRRHRWPGIIIGERVAIPAGLIPDDASVEIEAKIAAGYFGRQSPCRECHCGRPRT